MIMVFLGVDKRKILSTHLWDSIYIVNLFYPYQYVDASNRFYTVFISSPFSFLSNFNNEPFGHKPNRIPR